MENATYEPPIENTLLLFIDVEQHLPQTLHFSQDKLTRVANSIFVDFLLVFYIIEL